MPDVFAYGSLVAPESAARTLDRPIPIRQSWPPGNARLANLRGWRRRFSQARDNRNCEKTFARDDDGSVPEVVLGLNIEPDDGGEEEGDLVNGLLITVTEDELQRLDLRELRYDRVEVTGDIDASLTDQIVYAYTAKAEHLALVAPPGAVILSSYVKAVEDAFDRLGPGQLAAYRDSTDDHGIEPIVAYLVRDQIPPGNPREW